MPRRRFRIATLMLLVLVVGLGLASVQRERELRRFREELFRINATLRQKDARMDTWDAHALMSSTTISLLENRLKVVTAERDRAVAELVTRDAAAAGAEPLVPELEEAP